MTESNSTLSTPLRLVAGFVLPVVVVGAALLCAGGMVSMKSTPTPKVEEAAEMPTVQVSPLEPKTQPASVAGTGVVKGAQQVVVSPEVAGKIISMSQSLVPGGRFRAGETLVSLDGRNYRAAVAQQKQTLARAELDLRLEKNRGDVAVREWELLGNPNQKDASLAKREPHLVAAQRGLEAAEAGVVQAQANLGRTRITAPFNALVLEENADVGQVVQPGSNLATLVGTDAFWVQVALPLEKIDGMQFASNGQMGSPATISQRLGAGKSVARQGFVKQLMGTLDPQTRTAQVLVEIPAPLEGSGLPMLPGAYVDVAIEGKAMSDTWQVPRSALVDGEFVWVVDREGALQRRDVQIGWRNRNDVIITQGFQAGDRRVTSPLKLPIQGQLVTVTQDAG